MENKELSNVPLPLYMSDFASLRQYQKIYVDKTAYINEIAGNPGFYFFSRPRRFGKSLLLSTFESLFTDGLKDFKGLAIEHLWDENAGMNRDCLVMHLDFSGMDKFSTVSEFEDVFYNELDCFMQDHPVEETPGFRTANSAINRFKLWLAQRKRTALNKLVILIDEYDAPLNCCLDDQELFKGVAATLSNFYKVIKGHTGALRFMFITGICRFRHTTIFSGFNNLNDITMDRNYGTLLGYTEDEIRRDFMPYIERAARVLRISAPECIARMKEHYDGFCFDDEAATHVFSPLSVLSFLSDPAKGFRNYWFDTAGRPTVLMNYIKGHALRDPEEYGQDHVISTKLLNSAKELSDLDDISLLTQTGYLTVKGLNRIRQLIVNYPNREIAFSMATLYADQNVSGELQGNFADLFLKYDDSSFVGGLNAFVGQLSYEAFPLKDERSLQSSLYLCLMAAGADPDIEVRNAWGRSDLEVKVKDRYFVLELKYAREGDNTDSLLDEAISQIKGKHYGEYSFPELKHIRLALVFSGKERQFVRFAAC